MAVDLFRKFVEDNNIEIEIIESDMPTRTAQEAADVHNVAVNQIVKSLLVRVDDEFVLYLVPGDKRLDLASFEGKSARMATPEEVKEMTGYSIGGVPPFGHVNKIKTLIADGFPEVGLVIPAAGSGHSVFKIEIGLLKKIIQTVQL